MIMIYRIIFNRASEDKKQQILDNRGVVIGSFKQDSRQKFVYLVDNFFVEVIFVDDDESKGIEKASSFTNYRKLERYMEESLNEIKG